MNIYSDTPQISPGMLSQLVKDWFPEIAHTVKDVAYRPWMDEGPRGPGAYYSAYSFSRQKIAEGWSPRHGERITWWRVYTDEELTAKPKRFVGYCNTDAL